MTTTDDTTGTRMPDLHSLPWRRSNSTQQPQTEDTAPADAPATPPMPDYAPAVPAPEDAVAPQPGPEDSEEDGEDQSQEAEQPVEWWRLRHSKADTETEPALDGDADRDDCQDDGQEDDRTPQRRMILRKGGGRHGDDAEGIRVSLDGIPPKTRRLIRDATATVAGWPLLGLWFGNTLHWSTATPVQAGAELLLAGASVTAWKLARSLGPGLRIAGVVVAALAAEGEGAALVEALPHWGVDPALAVSAAWSASFACTGWWISRRTSYWWPPLAWICRAPLGCALTAIAIYH
ncbi:hypothetical protein ABZ746_23495 [Streptomyces sp. NPDC020096]